MVKKFEFTEILGWSHSRYATFTKCKRQYYFQYYRKYDLENVVKIAALIKLTNVPMEIGNISHKLISTLLKRLQRSSEEINPERFFDYVERKGKDIFRKKIFQEVYYQEKNRVDFESEILPYVRSAMENLITDDRFQWIKEEALAESEDWVIEPEGYGECRIEDMKAYCKVDFLFPIDDKLYVIDWKTGKRHDGKHQEQLKGYAAWVKYHFEKDWPQIETVVAYLLPEYEENSVSVNEYDIEDFVQKIRRETDLMLEYCAEPELNIPKEKDAFPMTENTKLCKWCNFRELCDR